MKPIIIIILLVTYGFTSESVPDYGFSFGYPQIFSLKIGKSIFTTNMKHGLSASIEPGISGIKQRITFYEIFSRYWCVIKKDSTGKIIGYGGAEEPNFIRNTGIALDFINSYYWMKVFPKNNNSINYGIELSCLIFKNYIEFMAPIKLSIGANIPYGKPIITKNIIPSASIGLSW